MSSNITTVGELRKLLAEYTDDTLVVVPHPESGHWRDEGTVDGPKVSVVRLWEVRTGWHVLHPSEADQYCPAAVLLSDLDGATLLEWQDDEFGGPSPAAPKKRA